jgi:hypothetical protein
MLLVLLAESELLKLFDLFASLFNRLIVNGLLLEIATAYVLVQFLVLWGLADVAEPVDAQDLKS